MRRPKLPSVEELCADARRVAVLEGIVDSTNIGAIFRSAAALNMDAVLVTPTCSDPLYRRAVRVSMGTIFQVPWTRIGEEPSQWPDAGLQRLRSLGFRTAAMALSDDSVSIEDPRLLAEERLAIVLGTEGDGLAVRTIAVSYTHLDVYKRQPLGSVLSVGHQLGGLMPGIGEAGFILALVGLRLAAAGLRGVDLLLDQGRPSLQHGIHPAEQDLFQNQIAVSYTHLSMPRMAMMSWSSR